MATFYGGDQLLDIKRVRFTSGAGADSNGDLIYTVPSGRIAFVQLIGIRTPASTTFSYWFYDPDLDADGNPLNGSGGVLASQDLSAIGVKTYKLIHPNAYYETDRGSSASNIPECSWLMEGQRIYLSYFNFSSNVADLTFLVHEYALP